MIHLREDGVFELLEEECGGKKDRKQWHSGHQKIMDKDNMEQEDKKERTI